MRDCPRMFLKCRCLDAPQRSLAAAGTSIGTLLPQKPMQCLQGKGSFCIFSKAFQFCCARAGVSPECTFGVCAAPAPLSSCKASPRDSRLTPDLIPLRHSSLTVWVLWELLRSLLVSSGDIPRGWGYGPNSSLALDRDKGSP